MSCAENHSPESFSTFGRPTGTTSRTGLLARSCMSTNLTGIAIGALVAAPIMMAAAIVAPEIAWMLGILLILLGVATVAKAFMDRGDAEEYVAGLVVAVFGLLTEVTSIEGLVYLTIIAVLVDAVFGAAERFS